MKHGTIVTILFILFMITIITALTGAIIYTSKDGVKPLGAGETSTTQGTVQSTTSVTTTTASTSTTFNELIPITTTTSTLPLKYMEIVASPKKIYRFDDAQITVSMSDDAKGSKLYVNGAYKDKIQYKIFKLLSMESGQYNIILEKEGYENGSIQVFVDQDTYATSRDVRAKLSRGEELAQMAKGKSVIRFYDRSGCNICSMVVGPLNKLVNDHRDCIVYEKLSYNRYAQKLGPGTLPFIEVEGSRGERKANGLVKMSSIKKMVESTSGCDIG